MFFRFVCALILAALVSMTGIVLEKQTLERKRDVSRQFYQLDLMLELHAQSRLRIQELASPTMMLTDQESLWSEPADSQFAIERYLVTENSNAASVDAPSEQIGSRQNSATQQSRLPLLRWQQPVASDPLDPNRR